MCVCVCARARLHACMFARACVSVQFKVCMCAHISLKIRFKFFDIWSSSKATGSFLDHEPFNLKLPYFRVDIRISCSSFVFPLSLGAFILYFSSIHENKTANRPTLHDFFFVHQTPMCFFTYLACRQRFPDRAEHISVVCNSGKRIQRLSCAKFKCVWASEFRMTWLQNMKDRSVH